MLNLAAFSPRDLATCRALLATCRAGGLTSLEQVEDLLTAANQPSPPSKVERQPVRRNLCPSCGRPTFGRVADVDGLRRYGCAVCRFSRLEG
jgi:hypothetical protein